MSNLCWKWNLELNFEVLSLGFDLKALTPQGLTGTPNYFGFLNNLITLIICESLREIGEMACVTSAWSARGQTVKNRLCKQTGFVFTFESILNFLVKAFGFHSFVVQAGYFVFLQGNQRKNNKTVSTTSLSPCRKKSNTNGLMYLKLSSRPVGVRDD